MKRTKITTALTREDLKKLHQKQIFLQARGGSCPSADFLGVSRAELTTQLSLSFPSVSALVDELLERHVLEESGEQEASDRGRPRKLLRVIPSLFYVPVFELKSEGYHFCLYDAYGTVVHEQFCRFSRVRMRNRMLWKPKTEEFCEPVIRCIEGLDKNLNLQDILLSLPGNINGNGVLTSSYIGVISPSNFLSYIEEKTGLNVRTINRSDSFAYAEQIYDPTLCDYVYIHISDGVGAGIIRNGYVFSCEPWRAGEIGHMSINYKGRACDCGSRGCLERYLSKRAMVEDCASLFDVSGVDFDLICQAYLDGMEQVEAYIENRAELLCVAMNNMFAMHPVTHVIIGGVVTKLGSKFQECMERKMYTQISRMYKGKPVITFSKREGNDSTFGAYHNYVTNIWDIDNVM